MPQSGCEKLIMNMVDNDRGMRDVVGRVSGPWEAESEECEAIPTIWNLGLIAQGGVTLSADIEAKLQRLTAINYDHMNLSWLLDPNMSLVPSVIPRVLAPSKNKPVVEFGRPRYLRRVVSAKRKSASTQSSQPRAPEEVGSENCWTFLHMRLFNTCFLQKRSKIGFDESDEEEMHDLLAVAPACPITNVGRSHMAEDA